MKTEQKITLYEQNDPTVCELSNICSPFLQVSLKPIAYTDSVTRNEMNFCSSTTVRLIRFPKSRAVYHIGVSNTVTYLIRLSKLEFFATQTFFIVSISI